MSNNKRNHHLIMILLLTITVVIFIYLFDVYAKSNTVSYMNISDFENTTEELKKHNVESTTKAKNTNTNNQIEKTNLSHDKSNEFEDFRDAIEEFYNNSFWYYRDSIFDNFRPFNTKLNTNITTSDKQYIVEFACLGFVKEELTLKIVGSNLVITGKKKNDIEQNHVYRKSFSYKFTLPNDVDKDHISSSLQNGILTVIILRKPDMQNAQLIQIN